MCPDPISRFATIYPPDRQMPNNQPTERLTDGIDDKPVTTPAYVLLHYYLGATVVITEQFAVKVAAYSWIP